MNGREGLRFIASAVELGHAHAAESQRWHLRAGASKSAVHQSHAHIPLRAGVIPAPSVFVDLFSGLPRCSIPVGLRS